MKKKFTVYLNNDLANNVEKLAEKNHFYVSQMIAIIVQSYISQKEKNKMNHNLSYDNNTIQSDRNQVDIRLLEMGVEGCLLSRKILENIYQDSENYQEAIQFIKQDAIQFVQQLSVRLKKNSNL